MRPTACRLTIIISEGDQYHHTPLYAEIVRRARHAGLAGASVFRGIEGYGASGRIHTSRLLSLGEELPVCIVIVDDEHRIRRFLSQLDETIGDGLVTLEPVEVFHRAGPHGARDDGRTE